MDGQILLAMENKRIVTSQNKWGTEYIWQTDNRKNKESVQIISVNGRRRMHLLDKALREEYVLYLRKTVLKKNQSNVYFYILVEAFNYINIFLSGEAQKSRLIAVNALKLMYSYLYLYNIDLEKLSFDQAKCMIDFFLNGNTVRENRTVSVYLAYIRKYVKYLGYDQFTHPFLSSKVINFKSNYSSEGITQTTIKNDITAKRYDDTANLLVKYHIRPEEYLKLREAKGLPISNKHNRLLARCIIDLMFLHGLRIGEVLSLTLEDFYTDSDGQACISIRNRFSNPIYRNAKGCMSVQRISDYHSRDYQKKDIGYQVVYLEKQVVQDIMEYISLMHDFLKGKAKRAYKSKSLADTVSQYIKSDKVQREMKMTDVSQVSMDGKNHYLFLNSRYAALTDSRWNQLLRQIFQYEHIGIDYGSRNFGLNHRFRHGYAVMLIHNLKMDAHVVQKLLRHKSIESMQPYLKMTMEDVRDMRTEYTKNLFDIIKGQKGKT